MKGTLTQHSTPFPHVLRLQSRSISMWITTEQRQVTLTVQGIHWMKQKSLGDCRTGGTLGWAHHWHGPAGEIMSAGAWAGPGEVPLQLEWLYSSCTTLTQGAIKVVAIPAHLCCSCRFPKQLIDKGSIRARLLSKWFPHFVAVCL